MLNALSRIKFVCFCLAALVLLVMFDDLRDVIIKSRIEPSRDQLQDFVAAAGAQATVHQQLSMSWPDVISLQKYLHYKLERFGLIGDIVLFGIIAIGLSILGMIGVIHAHSGTINNTIRRLMKAFTVTYWAAIYICLGFSVARRVNLYQLEASGLLDIKIPYPVVSSIRQIFGEPWSTQVLWIMILVLFWPVIRQIGKSIEEEESTV